MKRKQQVLTLAVLLPVFADAGGKRGDVRGLVVVLVDKASLGNPAHGLEFGADAVKDRGCRRARVLWVQRQHEQTLRAFSLQLVDRRGYGRFAVGHRQFDAVGAGRVRFETAADARRYGLRIQHQGGTLVGPYLAVGFCRSRRSNAQDDSIENQPPEEARVFHDSRIGQERLEKTPYCR